MPRGRCKFAGRMRRVEQHNVTYVTRHAPCPRLFRPTCWATRTLLPLRDPSLEMHDTVELSLVVPCYNDAGYLAESTARIKRVLDDHAVRFEIVFVEDHS